MATVAKVLGAPSVDAVPEPVGEQYSVRSGDRVVGVVRVFGLGGRWPVEPPRRGFAGADRAGRSIVFAADLVGEPLGGAQIGV